MGSLVAACLLHHGAMQLLLLGRTGRGKDEAALLSQKGGYVLITIARTDVSASEEAAYSEYAGACTNPYTLQVCRILALLDITLRTVSSNIEEGSLYKFGMNWTTENDASMMNSL